MSICLIQTETFFCLCGEPIELFSCLIVGYCFCVMLVPHRLIEKTLALPLAVLRVLTIKAQECCLGYRGKFGNDAVVPIGTLVSEMAMLMQEYTQMGGVRPFGVALLVASVEVDEGTRLYRLEPSGSYSAWKACAIGKGSAEAEAILHDRFKESMDRDSAVQLALSTVLGCAPNGVREEDVEIVCVEEGNIEALDTLDAR